MASLILLEAHLGKAIVQKALLYLLVMFWSGELIVGSAAHINRNLSKPHGRLVKFRGLARIVLVHCTHENPREIVFLLRENPTHDAGPFSPARNAGCDN